MNSIITVGDARELAKSIEDESCDFVFADPVYENIEDYLWLAQTAERILKPDRALLAFCSDVKMFTIKTLMDGIKGLSFVKPFYYVVEAKGSKLRGYGIYTWTTPALLYVKGDGFPKRTGNHCPDTKIEQVSTFISRQRPKGKFKWNKNPEVLGAWIRSFTNRGETVFDPFAGSGSIGYCCAMLERNCISFEIDPVVAEYANKRIASVQHYLPNFNTSQSSFLEGA